MADTNTDKGLVASSEFDPTAFIKGIDAMTASLEKLDKQEEVIRQDLKNINTALQANREELKRTEDQIKNLDKASKTYTEDLKKLKDQKTQLKDQNNALRDSLATQKTNLSDVNKSAKDYKNSLQDLANVSKKLAAEGKGRTLFDVESMNKQIAEVTAAGAKLKNVFQGKIDDKELEQFENALAQTGDEMQQLGQIVEFVKSKLDTLDPNSQEFADLSRIIQVGTQVLDEYGKANDNVEKKSKSLRGRLAELRTQLVQLEDQGKENTEEFQRIAIEAGQLQDAIGDAQNRIRVLASDTKNLDFGIGLIRGVASAFGVAEGAATLFGIKQEDIQESLARLNSIMLVLNGLQEIQNLLQKDSVVYIVGQEIATKAAAIAQRVYAFAVGTSTGAMKAFRIALLATGIGAFVVLLGAAADAMGLFGTETEEATDRNEEFTRSLDRAQRSLKVQTQFIKTEAQLEEERMKRRGATEKQMSDFRIKNLEKERDVLQAYREDIRAQAEQFIGAVGEGTVSGDMIDQFNQEISAATGRISDINDEIRLEREKNLTREFEDRKKNLEKQIQLYRAYQDRLTQLAREYRDAQLAATPQDEQAIRQVFKNQVDDAIADLQTEVDRGAITKKRAGILAKLIRAINQEGLDAAIRDFKKEQEQAEIDLQDSIVDLRMRGAEERIALIKDEFVREAQLVQAESERNAEVLRRERDDLIRSINETRDAGLISPEAAAKNIEQVKVIYAGLLDNLAEQTSLKQEEITARVFQATQNQLKTIFSNVQLFVSEAATQEIIDVTNRYLSGQIKYEEYQKELTRIAEVESRRRIDTAIRENEALLAGVQARIAVETDPARLKELQDQERQIRATLSDLKRQLAGADAEGQKKDEEQISARIQRIATYAQAIGGIVNQVVSFWQQANEAERQALENSISLQEQRVAAAVRIAERGNAEYLRLEEDRLNELQVRQENAARRQLAVNAILQTSQALTAFVSALAQGIATGGPLGGIAIAGAVLGLLASGYAIVSNLQKQNQQSFYHGTKSAKRNGQPAGRDTIPAMINEGEAVIPTATTEAYKPTVDAIFDRTVPAEDMNAFVNSYHVNRRSLPELNHERMDEAATMMVGRDGKLLEAVESQNRKLDEQSQMILETNKILKSMGITATIDKNGLSIALMKAMQKFKIDQKS